mmetsp:Transcript_1469/g.3156  ORF Transcript_1469/g.3156 Transcript_1469/m.3156 type:complete len:115 (-) Transcript_1469:240-584(-)
MVFTGKAFLPIVILVGSLIAAGVYVKNRGVEMSQANMVPMPMIGEINKVNREGPWPECVGLSYEDCSDQIESYTTGLVETKMFDEGVQPNGFDPKRVAIFVDKSGIVTEIPHKG